MNRLTSATTPAPRLKLSSRELRLGLALLALCLLAGLLPALAQSQDYHHFADARTLWSVPRAFDSLSNIGFLVLGLWGLLLSMRGKLEFFSSAMAWSTNVFFLGFVTTAAGSLYYHLAPNDAGLVWDRAGMVVAFAGVLGMAATHRISDRAGTLLVLLGLVLGELSVGLWSQTGSVTPYAVMQFGGIGLACAMMWAPSRGLGPNWAALLSAYALAKICETADAQIFALTGELVSGHTLKHFLAALPVLAVTSALRRQTRSGG